MERARVMPKEFERRSLNRRAVGELLARNHED
jgi:hypothetical protein